MEAMCKGGCLEAEAWRRMSDVEGLEAVFWWERSSHSMVMGDFAVAEADDLEEAQGQGLNR